MNNWELVIGIEIHIELNTKTKMFSPILNNYDSAINSNVSNIDLAYPGTLPLVNKEAIIKGLKLAKALNMQIDSLVRFDRKIISILIYQKAIKLLNNLIPLVKKEKSRLKLMEFEKILKLKEYILKKILLNLFMKEMIFY